MGMAQTPAEAQKAMEAMAEEAIKGKSRRSSTVEVVLPVGSMVPVAPGVTLRLVKVNKPLTGAATAVVAVRHGATKSDNRALEADVQRLTSMVEALVDQNKKGANGGKADGDKQLLETKQRFDTISVTLGQIQATLNDMDSDTLASEVAKEVQKKMGKLSELDEVLKQVAEGVRLLLDE